MSSSDSRWLPGLAAGAGIGAFALPLVMPWYLIVVLASAFAAIFGTFGRQRAVVVICTFFVVLLVFRTNFSAPIAAACLSAAALAMTKRLDLAVGVLLLNLSNIASAQELLGDFLHGANLEATSPALLSALVLAMASRSRLQIAQVLGSALLVIGLVRLAMTVVSAPETLMVVGAVPVVFAGACFGFSEPARERLVPPLMVIVIASLGCWFWLPPKSTGEFWLLLTKSPDAFESKFFSNYVEALRFGGLSAKRANSVEEIPRGATVLMPWLTAAFPDDRLVGELARQRHWTVVVGGEHNNQGAVATRIESLSGKALLRVNLTVPRGKTDNSGPMRMSEIVAWPHESILNRGASVTIGSLTDKVLLAGDGWWAEPDIGEWLWVGDYIWRNGDRAGRLAMLAVSNIGGARWVVLGDNSPLVNRQLVADPRAFVRILHAASLWPAFFSDLLIAGLAVALVFNVAPVIFVFVPLVAVIIAGGASHHPSPIWEDSYLGQSGFESRNFNEVIVDNPALIEQRRLIRLKAPSSGQVTLPHGPATIFMLVESSADIDGVRLDRCRRLGSLATSDGPFLMDAQACRVSGQAKILIGTRQAAAAIAVGETIVILDTAFLAQNAPKGNAEWLIKEIRK